VADLDEDGHLDAVLAHADDTPPFDSVTALYNDGVGGIDTTVTFDIPCPLARGFDCSVAPIVAVRTSDLDEDGHGDVIVLHESAVSFLWGTGIRGALDGPDTFGISGPASELGIADLDADGHSDLVISGRDRAELRIHYGRGDRQLVSPDLLALPAPPTAFAIGHADSDGRLDLLVGDPDRLRVLLGENGRSFDELDTFRTAGDEVSRLALADLDGDGQCDAVALADERSYTTRVTVHDGNGTGIFEARYDYAIERPLGMATADFDEDGHLDVLVGHLDTRPTILLGDGEGGLTFGRNIGGTLGSPENGTLVATGDFNDDGLADAVIGNLNNRIGVYLGKIGLDFEPPHEFYDISSIPLRGFTVTDLDADGRDDLVVISECQVCLGPARGFEEGYLTTYLSNGNGTFTRVERRFEFPPWDGTLPVPGDYDEDGNMDLLYSDEILHVLLGDGTGHLTFGSNIQPITSAPAVADFDRDGHLDFASVEYPDEVWIYRGRGDGTFVYLRALVTEGRVELPAVADFDGDGSPDIVTSGIEPLLLRGNGSGAFAIQEPLWCEGTFFVTPGDFDGDGQIDLAVSNLDYFNPQLDRVSILRNRTLDHIASRKGNVNARTGPVTDVLFVNDSTGSPYQRRLVVDRNVPLSVDLVQPPSRSMAAGTGYVLYAALGAPTPSTTDEVPYGIGRTCLVTPLNGGSPAATWNTLGHPEVFGPADYPSGLAPGTVFRLVHGVRLEITFTLQGFILDRRAPNGILATTNAVVVESR
jgi:hypothetical protein